MTDIRRLGQIILDRIIAEVPEISGRAFDKAIESTTHPYVSLGPITGTEDDADCVEADEWTLQVDIWDRTNKLRVAELAQSVRLALKGWADQAEVTMHPLQVRPARILDDPDGKTVHAVLMVEALVERD